MNTVSSLAQIKRGVFTVRLLRNAGLGKVCIYRCDAAIIRRFYRQGKRIPNDRPCRRIYF